MKIWKKKKKITKFIVRLTGEWKAKNLENFGKFWLFLEFFGKLTFFETSHYNNSQNSRIYKFEEKKKKIILRFSGEKSSEKTEMML